MKAAGKSDIKDLSREELGNRLAALDVPAYRAGQVFKWLFDKRAGSFDDMTDLPVGLRTSLKSHFHVTRLKTADSKTSVIDGTVKYLFALEDGNTIEAVFLPEKDRATACLSSQVGCKYACSFCASAPFGFVRNLKASEMLDEVLSIKAAHPRSPVTNIVFMGIGEPLDNYDNVMRAVRILNDKDAFNIGARKITISTCGIIPGIERLKSEGMQVELSVSLHSADEDTRSTLVPINKRYPLKMLIPACRDYVKETGRIITFEYILMRGVNCSKADALKLAGLLRGIKCKVNTISYNQVRSIGRQEPAASDIKVFIAALKQNGVNAMHRKSRGEDIDAGCGQLRISKL